MRGCALRKVVRNLAHKKLENRGVEPQFGLLTMLVVNNKKFRAAGAATARRRRA